MHHELDWEEDFDDWEYPDDDDEGAEEPAWVNCPECGSEMLEDLSQCPNCGQYVVFSTNAYRGMPLSWIVVGALGIAAVLAALLLRF